MVSTPSIILCNLQFLFWVAQVKIFKNILYAGNERILSSGSSVDSRGSSWGQHECVLSTSLLSAQLFLDSTIFIADMTLR